MLILIGCAKIMTGRAPREILGCSEPRFQPQANGIAAQLADYTPEQLMAMLRCNKAIATENWRRYREFGNPDTLCPAAFSYDGMVFQKLAPETMSDADLAYANEHLMIGSFLYGLLRPLDLVNPYRLEGDVELPGNGHISMFDYWKPLLTGYFIDRVKADDGVLINLASAEFKRLFDWKRVTKEVTVITPDFKVVKEGKPKNVTIYAKMCRGAMSRWIIQNRITDLSDLRHFDYEGFHYTNDWNYICES